MISSKSYNSKEMSTLLDISITSLWRYQDLGLIPQSKKFGGRRKWSREVVDRFIEEQFGVDDEQKRNKN